MNTVSNGPSRQRVASLRERYLSSNTHWALVDGAANRVDDGNLPVKKESTNRSSQFLLALFVVWPVTDRSFTDRRMALDQLLATHVRTERLGNSYRAVVVLVVLQNGDHYTRHRNP